MSPAGSIKTGSVISPVRIAEFQDHFPASVLAGNMFM